MFTDKRLRYWLDQEYKTDSNGNLLYPYGPMRLLMELSSVLF